MSILLTRWERSRSFPRHVLFSSVWWCLFTANEGKYLECKYILSKFKIITNNCKWWDCYIKDSKAIHSSPRAWLSFYSPNVGRLWRYLGIHEWEGGKPAAIARSRVVFYICGSKRNRETYSLSEKKRKEERQCNLREKKMISPSYIIYPPSWGFPIRNEETIWLFSAAFSSFANSEFINVAFTSNILSYHVSFSLWLSLLRMILVSGRSIRRIMKHSHHLLFSLHSHHIKGIPRNGKVIILEIP